MCRTFGVVTIVVAAIGMAVSLTPSAHAGDGSAIGAGLFGFGIGAILGSMLTPTEVYYLPPPPPEYYDPPPPTEYYDPAYDGPPQAAPKQHHSSNPISKTKPHVATKDRRLPPTSPTKMAKTTPPINAAQKAEMKFRAAQAKAKRDGVQNLTQEDIEGLSHAQIKQLRGY